MSSAFQREGGNAWLLQVSAVLAQLCSAARARGGLKDMRMYLAHGAGSKAASSYLGELTARMLSGQPVADMQHNAASLRYGYFPLDRKKRCHEQPSRLNGCLIDTLQFFRHVQGF